MITEDLQSKVRKRLSPDALVSLHIGNVITRPRFGSSGKPTCRQAFDIVFAVSLRRTTRHSKQLDKTGSCVPSFGAASPAINEPTKSINMMTRMDSSVANSQQFKRKRPRSIEISVSSPMNLIVLEIVIHFLEW